VLQVQLELQELAELALVQQELLAQKLEQQVLAELELAQEFPA
jgi:hypothetical protein